MTTLTTGKATEFIQFTRASNATVTDIDGKIKWAPHNLLTNSESFDAASWLKTNLGSTTPTVTANAAVAPNGTTTAEVVTFGEINAANDTSVLYQTFTALDTTYRGGVYIKAAAAGDVGKKVWMFMYDSAYRGVASVTLTTEWQLLSATATLTGGVNREFYIATIGSTNGGENQGAVSVHIWGAHLYRSDLGGMQANTSAYPMYNPTTPKNLLGYTEDFSNAYWQRFRSTATSNAAIAPNGLQTADKLVPQSGLTQGGLYNTAVPIISGGVYTASVYVKAAELGFAFIALNARASSTTQGVCVNLATGTLTNQGASATYSATSVGDGWWRVSCSGTAAFTSGYIEVYPLAAAGTNSSYTGDGTSGIYLWGAQLSDSASLDTYSPVYGAAVTSAAYYGPRRDFDPVTLACKGLLVEEQRTNLVLNSNAVGTTTYLATITANSAVSPTGETNAGSLSCTSVAGRVYFQVNVVTATAYVFSVFIKAGTNTSAYLELAANAGNNTVVFNLSNGTITSGTGGSITPASNGYYRCSIAFTSIGTGNAEFRVGTGDATSKTIFVFGAQLEAGSFATSYIPTGAATATRNGDVASVSTQAFPYNSTEGTVVVNATSFTTSTSVNRYIGLVLSSAQILNRLVDVHRNIAAYNNYKTSDTSNTVFGTWRESNKLGVAYKADDYACVDTGGSVATDTSTSGLATADLMVIGQINNASQLNGHIRQITYLPRRISNTELQTRTA